METKKTVNLLNSSDNENSKFATKKMTAIQKVITHPMIE